MKKENLLLIAVAAFAVGGVIWAFSEKQKKDSVLLKLKQKDIDGRVLQTNYLVLLQEYLGKQHSLPDSIKEQLLDLREQYIGIQDDIANALKEVIGLLENKNEELAIANLTKIIENLLKDRYVAEHLVETREKCPNLHQMIEHAKKSNWITERSFHFSMVLKEERNFSFHELNPILSENEKLIGFLSGIEVIYNLKGFKNNC